MRKPVDRQAVAFYEGSGLHIRNALIDAAGRKPNMDNPRLDNQDQEQVALMGRHMIWNGTDTGAEKLRAKLEVAAVKLRAEMPGLRIEITVRDMIYVGKAR